MPWDTDDDVKKHKKNLTSKQMAQWRRIANSVLKRLMKKGKSEKEAAAEAIRQANGVVNANTGKGGVYSVYKNKQKLDYEPKLTVHQDKVHMVLPVVMMVEGVHNGSQGPLLHEIAELGKFPASWNGIPVVIYHPEVEGEPVSANSPEIIDTQTVGRVYNTNVEDNKLKAEVWFDEDKLNSIAPQTLEDINNSLEVEVSLGMFTENEMGEGEYNGEKYIGIAKNHRPDHLAILPDQVGACSCKDGCGLGANQKQEDMKTHDVIKNLNKEGFSVNEIGNHAEDGYNERMSMVYDKLRSLDKEWVDQDDKRHYVYNYLEECYDDYLIYSVSGDNSRKMYKQTYKVESGKIEFVGEPIEVHKKVDYVVNFSNNQKKEDAMSKNNECPKCVEKINALIGNKESGFDESDREWLTNLTEAQLEKVSPKVIEKTVEKIVEVNKLTPEQTADLAFVAQQRTAKRNELIAGIQVNTSKEMWPDDVLKGMDENMLKRVYDSVKKENIVDYSFNAIPPQGNASDDVEPLLPPDVELKK